MNSKDKDEDHFKAFGEMLKSRGVDITVSRLPIRTRLRDLASQEGCDGEPYDTMQEAAEYIEQLERKLSVMSLMEIEIDNKTKHIAYLDKKLEDANFALLKNSLRGKIEWQPIETIPEGLFVDVWVVSKNNPEWGIRLCNVCKNKNHSSGWVGIEKKYLTDDIYPVMWMYVDKPKQRIV